MNMFISLNGELRFIGDYGGIAMGLGYGKYPANVKDLPRHCKAGVERAPPGASYDRTISRPPYLRANERAIEKAPMSLIQITVVCPVPFVVTNASSPHSSGHNRLTRQQDYVQSSGTEVNARITVPLNTIASLNRMIVSTNIMICYTSIVYSAISGDEATVKALEIGLLRREGLEAPSPNHILLWDCNRTFLQSSG
jgi:hypothetical protein